MIRRLLPLLLLAASLGLAAPARAAISLLETDPVSLDLGADVKSFSVLLFPYEHPILYPVNDPQGMGALDLRGKLHGRFGDHLSFKFHPQLTATSLALAGSSSGGASPMGGGSASASEALTLSHTWPDTVGARQTLAFRIDRLFLKFDGGPVSITLGRQPISFGTAFFFSPMDLVSPFSATTIDQEYRPGIDAARFDLYVGESTTFTLVGAYAGTGDWGLEDLVFAGRGGTTFGTWDVGAFAALNHEDLVLGLDGQGSIGPVAVRAEGTVTVPPEGGSVFYRMVLGASAMFEKGSVSGELYWQSTGELESINYAAFTASPRMQRGELWVMGRYYAAVSASYELHPLVQGSLFGIMNLVDPSALIGPGLSWSIADNASLDFGLYLGVGKRPADSLTGMRFDLGSEFGPMPVTSFLVLKAYL